MNQQDGHLQRDFNETQTRQKGRRGRRRFLVEKF
jgi:hypothetical protein